MAVTKTKTIRVWQTSYEKLEVLQMNGWIPRQLNSDASRFDYILDAFASMPDEREKESDTTRKGEK